MSNFHKNNKIDLDSKIEWTYSQKSELVKILTYVCTSWTLMYLEESKGSILKELHLI
jgi:hypothetical protein